MWYEVIALICFVLVIFWNPVFEHMTNADVQKKLDHHTSNPKKWEMPNPEDTKEKLKARSGKQVFGPRVPESEMPDPNAPKPKDADTDKMTYPDIYGPERLEASGSSKSNKKAGDSNEPSNYDFVPAAEFPAGPSEPAPFLGDFSSFLK